MVMDFIPHNIEIAAIVVFGALFGYFLEASGLGSPKKLNAQFVLKDWSVFKVMFTSIVVAAMGLLILDMMWLIDSSTLRIPTTFFWAMLIGGALLGIGLNIGGYCPGTSVVGFFSGRIDALFFMIGMIIGVLLFAIFFEFIEPLYLAAQGPESQTLSELIHLPTWTIVIILFILAVAGFILGNRFEEKSNGVISSDDLDSE
jgi:uncharacterized protein